ncbi:MAG: hypothetical protein EOM25_12990 [Deltaproteobacteria bacterium]|nr:hypothetical protein [Deltaproteobacteria bacterium]
MPPDQPGASAAINLTYTQELRPPYSPNGSQPSKTAPFIITHDPKTGEVFEFGPPEKNGTCPKLYTSTDHQNTRNDRYAMRWAIDSLLPGSRQSKCHRWRVPKLDVEVKLSVEHERAFFAGCEVCGSVWGCPLCAPKITERRRVEVETAMETAKAQGLKVMLATFTIPHGIGSDVEVIRKQIMQAWRRGTDSRAGKNMRKMIGLRGYIRVVEVTYGQNGWHPHFHVLLFLETSLTPEVIRQLWFPIWLDGCRKVGLDDPSLSAFHVDDGTRAAHYVTKWGMDSELTKGHLKQGKKSVNPWDLLRIFTFGPSDRRISPELQEVVDFLGIDKKRAAELWLDFFRAFKGTRQLYWSNGLRALLGLSAEKSDQEVAEEQLDPLAAVLAVLNAHWTDIITTRANARILNRAEDAPAHLPDLLDEIRLEAAQKRDERLRRKSKKQGKKLARIQAPRTDEERSEGDPERSKRRGPTRRNETLKRQRGAL